MKNKKELLKWIERLIESHDKRDYIGYAEDGYIVTSNIDEWVDNAASCLYQIKEILK